MTTSPVASISDDELASIREYVKRQDKADNSPVCVDFRELRGLVSRLQDAEKDAARYRWLREFIDQSPQAIEHLPCSDGDLIDDVIDAEMEQQP